MPLVTQFNAATGAQEVQHWTPGPWSLAGLEGVRLDGVDWALEAETGTGAWQALGLSAIDTVLLYEIDLAAFEDPGPLDFPSDPSSLYPCFQKSFAERWEFEGISAEAWQHLWLQEHVERRVSGAWMKDGEPLGFIIAEQWVPEPHTRLFYRTFGIHPAARGQSLGYQLYARSLALGKQAGYSVAQWGCFASNEPICTLMSKLGAQVISECQFWSGPLDQSRSGILA